MEDYARDLAYVESQLQELEKTAVSAGVFRRLGDWYKGLSRGGQAWVGRGGGAALGAGAGAGIGAATAPEEDRAGGAVRGALRGAMVGLVPGQLATRAGRRQVTDFGKRQFHGLTGWMPGQKGKKDWMGKQLSKSERAKRLKEIGFHVPEHEATLEAAKKHVAKEMEGPGMFTPKPLSAYLPEGVRRHVMNLQAHSSLANRELAEKGMMSIPGVATGMVRDPKGAMKASLVAPGLLGAGLGLGFGVPPLVEGVKARDPAMIGGALAETAGYGMMGGLPMIPAMAVGTGARYAGELPGRVVRALRQNQPPREEG